MTKQMHDGATLVLIPDWLVTNLGLLKGDIDCKNRGRSISDVTYWFVDLV